MTAAPQSGDQLRVDAEAEAARLPALLADAQHLSAAISLGEHGRRRAGLGEEFWQFRTALPGDNLRDIDWRRSAKSDTHFIRQKEWQAAQSVRFWIDAGASMAFSGDADRPQKLDRARVLGLACAMLLARAGERFGHIDDPTPPKTGQNQINRFAAHLMTQTGNGDHDEPHAVPPQRGSRIVFVSDCLGDLSRLSDVIAQAADNDVKGAILQVLDPVEEAFPFDGRTIFESVTGAIRFETLRARGVRQDYLARLSSRKAEVAEICKRTGWQYLCHHTDQSPQSALMWLYEALERTQSRNV